MPSQKTPFPQKFLALSLRYGIISAVFMSILTLLFFYFSGTGNTPVIIWNYLVITLVVFGSVKTYRKKISNRNISFKEAYVSGVSTGIVASFVFAIFMIFYTKYIDIEFIKNFISINALKINKDTTADELNRQIQLITPVIIGFYAFFQLILISFILPFLIFILFKQKRTVKT